ncbi:MAG: amino acid adenylation domain-containing protein [Saprospiraceae bacterium]|nr:amino acid adenylation domain-containing protein [Saprospiraceae bacterium]
MNELRILIEHALTKHAAQIALVEESGDQLSYQDLDVSSAGVAHHLQDNGVGQGQCVAICIPKSSVSVACLLGALRSNVAYIPLDPDAPASRNGYIVRDATASMVLTTRDFANVLLPHIGSCQVLDITVLSEPCKLLVRPQVEDKVVSIPDDLAYILYTSGSTGQPKGVMITHRNATCFVRWGIDLFQLRSSDVLSSIAPFHFDLSVFDLYAGLGSGAKILLIRPESVKNPMILAEFIDQFAITIWYATPTTLKMMLRFGRMNRYHHSSLRHILFAGEVFPLAPLNDLRSRWSHAAFHNLYGPTETNVCTYFSLPREIDPTQEKPFPIGASCPYAQCFIDDGTSICPPEPGMVGELLIAGDSVMAGYLNQPERNAKALLVHDHNRCYRTGDIVQYDQGGQLHYISRKDRMVKRHGNRIELGEIEAALHEHPEITEAGVFHTIAGADHSEIRIVACYATVDPDQQLAVSKLQTFLQQYVPSYMLPDKFVYLATMPKTSTHKVDYTALKENS